jgi:hypothetical protein
MSNNDGIPGVIHYNEYCQCKTTKSGLDPKIYTHQFLLKNIKLLESPYKTNNNLNEDMTTIPILLNSNLKKFISTIYHRIGNKQNCNFVQYNSVKNCDYFNMYLNKYISQICDNLEPYTAYNLTLQLNLPNSMKTSKYGLIWKLCSVEMSSSSIRTDENNSNDEYDEEFDIIGIRDAYLEDLSKVMEKNYIQLKWFRDHNKNIQKLYQQIQDEFNINDVESYNKSIKKLRDLMIQSN